MKTVFQKLLDCAERQLDTVLTVIISDSGSAPRGTGSVMLTGSHGRIAGTVGGGSVEFEAEQEALRALRDKKSLMRDFTLRAGSSGDIGMVCGGDVSLLFQFLDGSDGCTRDLARRVLTCMEDREAASLAFYGSGTLPRLIPDGGPIPEGEAPVLLQPLPLGEPAVIFGGGHIAKALCPLLASVGFRVTVMDCRESYADASRFPSAERVLCGSYTELNEYFTFSGEEYIAVMTSGHEFDAEIEEQLLRREFAYIGVIGSKAKTAAVNARLIAAGIPEEAIARVHAPIGTPIKAVTPEEIAVSIAGEMILCRALSREQSGVSAGHGCPMHEKTA